MHSLSRSILLLTTGILLCHTACGRPAATTCIFNEDCAEPHEYCDIQTELCTPYECLADKDCDKDSRCSVITNTCVPRPMPDMRENMPDMSMMPDLPEDMEPEDFGQPDFGQPDLGSEDLGQPDLSDRDRTPPAIINVSPPVGQTLEASTPIVVTFSEPLDDISVGPSTVRLSDDEGFDIPAEILYDNAAQQLIVTPTEAFPPSKTYTLKLDEAIRDPALNTLERSETLIYYRPFQEDQDLKALAAKWAPTLYQEIASIENKAWRHDIPSRIDFDGDWQSNNNLDNLPDVAPGDYRATVYYQVTQTDSHHYLTYVLYYPSRTELNEDTMMEVRREHDFTGVLLVVERESDELLFVEGLRVEEGTDLIIAFLNKDRDVDLPGQGRIKGDFMAADLVDGTHYPLYVPAKRHEACNWQDPEPLPPFDVCLHPESDFREGYLGAVITHADEGVGIEQATQQDSDAPFEMTYALKSFEESFWFRSELIGGSLIYSRGTSYSPLGERPRGPGDERLYLPQDLSSDDDNSFGKTPFKWLTQPARRNVGQWLVDPTWTVRQRYSVPQTPMWSYDYCYNLFLGVDLRSEPGCMTAPPVMP